jgi:predicted ribosomally synthesized peptide with SipW-like signal peptide
MDKEKFELSRRKALVGLGTIGVAGAGAGMGTSALFTDEETFENNSFTAGTLNMVVDAEVVATVDNPYWNNTIDLEGKGQEADGPAIDAAIDIEDAKPGDWMIICFTITNEENPGYVQISTSDFGESENGISDPEDDVDSSSGDGELDEKLLATAWSGLTVSQSDLNSRDELEGLQYPTNLDNGDKPSHTWDSSRNEDGVVNDGVIEYTSVREAHNAFSSGVVVADSGGAPKPVGTNATGVDGPAADEDPAVFYLLLEIPKSVGNEIQSDSVTVDLDFETEQVRNNPNPFS